MSQREKTSARGLVLPRSSSPENDHLRNNLFSVYCFVDHFRLLVLFFIWPLWCLSLLKNSLKTPKAVIKTRKW
jgi:hypothetical protein